MPNINFHSIKDFILKKDFSSERKFALSTSKSALILFSLVTAHYSGFLVKLPFEMLSIMAVDFLPLFVSLLLLYFSLCYTVARVFSFTIEQSYSSFLILVVALVVGVGKFFGKFPKQGVKMYKEVRVAEKIIYLVFLLMIFLFVFDFSYLKINLEHLRGWVGFCFAVSVVTLIFKTDILVRNPKKTFKRLVDPRRVRYRRKLREAAVYIAAGAILSLSFYSGYWRFEKLVGDKPLHIESDRYSGVVNVLIGSGGSFFGIERCSIGSNYIYLNEGLVIRLAMDKEGDSNVGGKTRCDSGYIPLENFSEK